MYNLGGNIVVAPLRFTTHTTWNKYQLLRFMFTLGSFFRRGRCKTGEQPWYCPLCETGKPFNYQKVQLLMFAVLFSWSCCVWYLPYLIPNDSPLIVTVHVVYIMYLALVYIESYDTIVRSVSVALLLEFVFDKVSNW